MSEQFAELYEKIRATPSLWAELATETELDGVAARIGAFASAQGYSLDESDIRTGIAQFDSLVGGAEGSVDLTDDELELVSAGFQVKCNAGLARV